MHQLSHNMHTKAVRWLSPIHKYTLGVHLMCWLTPRATWLSLIGPTESPHPINSVRRRCCCEMQHTSKLLHSHCKHGAAVSCYADPSLQAQSAQLGTTLEYRELNMHIYIYVRESALLFCPLWRDAERCWPALAHLIGTAGCTMLKLTAAVHQLFPGCWELCAAATHLTVSARCILVALDANRPSDIALSIKVWFLHYLQQLRYNLLSINKFFMWEPRAAITEPSKQSTPQLFQQ